MENSIQQIAAKFNQEHGRAMTFKNAFDISSNMQHEEEKHSPYVYTAYKFAGNLLAESVKQFERTKVIEEVQYQLDLWLSPENSKQYWEVKTIITGLKSHPLDTNEK